MWVALSKTTIAQRFDTIVVVAKHLMEGKGMRQASRQTVLSAPHVNDRSTTRQAGKMLVPLLGILAVLSMVVAAAASIVLMQEREKRQAKEHALQIAVQQNEELKSQLESVQQAKTQVEGELARSRRDLVEKEEKLSKAIEAQQTLSKSVDDRQQEIVRLTKDLEQTRNDSKQLTTQLSDLQAEREKLKVQLADVEKAKGELETKLVESTERPTVELEKVLVTNNGKTDGATPPQRPRLPQRARLLHLKASGSRHCP